MHTKLITTKQKLKKKLIILVLLALIVSCNENKSANAENHINENKYDLVEGLYIERRNDSIPDFDYNSDNRIFTPFSDFKYSYKYIKNQDTLYFEPIEIISDEKINYDWKFVDEDNLSDSTIIRLRLSSELNSKVFGPDYKQTIVRYDYIMNNNEHFGNGELTGSIDNEKNIWLHPPRGFLFRILELNPFPYIQEPYEVGNKWEGELTIGTAWGDKRWKVLEETILNKYEYEIINKKKIMTSIGELNCLEVNGVAKSKIGTTYLKSLFSFEEGFVQLNYTNIDGSQIIFDKIW